jgi:hypothetical protein
MKASLEQLGNSTDGSFLFRQFNLPYFDAPYHFHPEFELTLILKSEGKRFVGNQVADFKEGDLVLLGPTYLIVGRMRVLVLRILHGQS